ncbi:murein hydrolase activator EnvC family protein [Rhodococcus sp. SGAir0479]|uniref:murein hydrolase activator EnvC family protein n=1 Tax=Rhodococcus sp. SGAir0479 TaxID=2567884 RepID=UPI0010CD36DE|nr:M23 family metallopeptidase [Rhodococcus sp. SGAir0479]QCQ90639.1 M23 family metallopeptidase [Rhodococcus sp. SGAir0479]
MPCVTRPVRRLAAACVVGLVCVGATAPADAAAPRTPPAAGVDRTDETRPGFDWPLRPRPRVVRAFDKPAQNWLSGHRGVDLGAVPGQSVLAAGAGTVAFAGTVAGKPVVSVDHPGGLRTTYEPVEATVTAGRVVARGTPLGTVAAGHPACAAATCLHWGLRRDRDYLDPLPLVRTAPIRLLPTGAGQARG